MSDDIKANKISDKQARRADHIQDKLEKKGMGQDQARKEAQKQVIEETGGYADGGPSAGGEPHKGADHRR